MNPCTHQCLVIAPWAHRMQMQSRSEPGNFFQKLLLLFRGTISTFSCLCRFQPLEFSFDLPQCQKPFHEAFCAHSQDLRKLDAIVILAGQLGSLPQAINDRQLMYSSFEKQNFVKIFMKGLYNTPGTKTSIMIADFAKWFVGGQSDPIRQVIERTPKAMSKNPRRQQHSSNRVTHG